MNEFGIVVSGPIIKNKLFLFGNYGQYRFQQGPTIASMTIPTLSELGYDSNGNALPFADFRGYAAATGAHIYDPSTQVPGLLHLHPAADDLQQCRGRNSAQPHPRRRRTITTSYCCLTRPLPHRRSFNNNLAYAHRDWAGELVLNRQHRLQPELEAPGSAADRVRAAGGDRLEFGQRPQSAVQYLADPTIRSPQSVDIVKDTWT